MLGHRLPAITQPRSFWRAMALGLLMLVASLATAAAQNYPALSGRIVDEAGIVPAAVKSSLETKLSDLETKSGIQLVVATIKSLGGGDIETYANGLFRKWQLGEKQKNNGVLFIVAPNDRKVRIEVGYGLEGTLTDALSKVIITNAVAPRFKANDFGGGIERGVDDIITVLTTDSSEWQKRPDLRLVNQDDNPEEVIIAGLIILFILLMIVSQRFRRFVGGVLAQFAGAPTVTRTGKWNRSGSTWTTGATWGGGGSSWGGGSSGGGFSGGGGSSGGGGASGDW